MVSRLKDEATSVIGTVAAAAPVVKRRPETRSATPPPPPKNSPEKRPYKRSRRGPVLLGLVLVLALVAAGTGWYFGIGRYTTTPGVIDLPQAAAKAKIAKAGLTFEVGRSAFSETVTKGAVIATDPKAGDRILDSGTVTAVISLGPERHPVPTLRGLTVDQASAELEEAKLDVGRITQVFNESIAKGIVIRSTPAAKTELAPDTAVSLVVSKGRKPVKIKDYVGKNAAAAERKLTALGLKVDLEQDYSETLKKGLVISQDPTKGATLFKGDEITLVVSQGPPLVEVPNVRAQGVDSATQELQAAGFVVSVQQHPTYIGLGFVYSQSPAAGEMLPKGSVITIYLV